MKLVSMREFVLEQHKAAPLLEDFNKVNDDYVNKVINYAKFLSQPLTLGMFVPCDEDGNVLECPHNYGALNLYPTGDMVMDLSFQDAIIYHEANERVLFEGFSVNENMIMLNGGETPFITRDNLVFYDGDDIYQLFTIEDIVFYGEDPELTPSAIKQLSL